MTKKKLIIFMQLKKVYAFTLAFICLIPICSLTCSSGEDVYSSFTGEIVLLSGTVNNSRTLTPDTTYHIIGNLIISPNATLVIDKGTRIYMNHATKASLIALRGSKVFFNGTEDEPVVFTSDLPIGRRKPGDWGGLLFLGSASNNIGDNVLSDASLGYYGGKVSLDGSGTLRYVRAEFAGANLGSDTRLAGFGFYSIGLETQINNLQAHQCASDGFRFRGGTVNAKYLVSTGNVDDGFEISNSWIGKGQYWVCIQKNDAGNNGYKIIGNTLFPQNKVQVGANIYLTTPTIYNATLIGRGTRDSDGVLDEVDAINILSNARCFLFNHVIANFPGLAMNIDQESAAQLQTGNIFLRNSVIHVKGETSTNGVSQYGSSWSPTSERNKEYFSTFSNEWDNTVVDPLLTNINYSNTLPGTPLDILPSNSSPLTSQIEFATPQDPSVRFTGDDTTFFEGPAFGGAVSTNLAWMFKRWIVWYNQ